MNLWRKDIMGEKILYLVENAEMQIDEGMCEDLRAFFRDDDRFSFFHITIDEKIYSIKIGIFGYSCPNVRLIFCEFLNFIGYRYMNVYNIDYTDNECTIEYLTFMNEKVGAEMKITFLPAKEI